MVTLDYRDQHQLCRNRRGFYDHDFLGASAFSRRRGENPQRDFVSYVHTDQRLQVVNEGSARLNKTKEFVIGLDANHLTMCKFSSSSGLYTKVLRRLSAEMAAIGTPVGEDENELRTRNLLESVPKIPTLKSSGGLT